MTVTWEDGHGRLVVAGEIDMANCGPFREAVDAAIASGPEVLVIDAAALVFCDSTCVACILRALQAGLRVRLVDVTESVARVLEISGIDRHEHLTIE